MASRVITTLEEWESVPVGTPVKFDYFETGEGENDDRTMTVIRVEDPVLAAAGAFRLAGGQHWSDMWHYEQGVTVLALSPSAGNADGQPGLPEDALVRAQVAAKNTFLDNRYEAEKFSALPYEARLQPWNSPPPMPWMAIVAKLVELGWAPPAKA